MAYVQDFVTFINSFNYIRGFNDYKYFQELWDLNLKKCGNLVRVFNFVNVITFVSVVLEFVDVEVY